MPDCEAGNTDLAPALRINALLWKCLALTYCCALACRAALGAISEMSNYRCGAADPAGLKVCMIRLLPAEHHTFVDCCCCVTFFTGSARMLCKAITSFPC
jgi:hypothetical protein